MGRTQIPGSRPRRPAAYRYALAMSEPRWTRLRASAARVAAGARDANRSPAAVEALRRARRALPGDSGFGDPLSAAGRDSAGTIARVAGRLFDEQPTASREVTLAGLQLWHSLTERVGRGGASNEVTIAFTDLVGFSSWALRAGDEETLHLLRAVASATEPVVRAHRGQVVKRLGDGLMAIFPSPQLAFDATAECIDNVGGLRVDGWRPRLRVGLHTGHPRPIGGDYLGVDVNIAARLAEAAGSDEILISEDTLHGLDPSKVAARRKKTFGFKKMKGVPDQIVIYTASPR